MSEDAANEVMDRLDPDDFYHPSHRDIYEAIRALFNANSAIDAITVSEELRKAGRLDKVGGVAYLTRLLDIVPSTANVDFYAAKVEEYSQRRMLMKAGGEINDLALHLDDEIHTVLDRAEQTVLAVAGRKVGDSMQPIGPLFFTALEELEDLESRGSEVTGLSTGFRDLDSRLTGLHAANLVIIAARPGMGKCLAGSTLLVDPKSGERIPISEFVQSKMCGTAHVMALATEALRLVPADPSEAVESGIQDVYRITTRLGRTVTSTAEHPFFTMDGWAPLSSLGVGSAIAVARRIDVFGVDEVSEDRLVELARIHDDLGSIPSEVFRLPSHQLKKLLALMFGIHKVPIPGEPFLRSVKRRIVEDVQHLLLRFGIVARIRKGSEWELLLDDPGSAMSWARRINGLSSGASVEVPSGSDILFDPIISIEPMGAEQTFDLEVPVYSNFVAGDVVVHNSALSANIATNIAMRGLTVAMFSLEMSKEEVASRMLCSVARIDSMKLRTGSLSHDDWARLTDAAGRLFSAPVYVDDSPVVTVTDIRAKCRRLQRRHGLALIVVDYLQLMQGTSKENRQQEIAEISRQLKNLARELDVPVLAVSQLNRNLEAREDKRPRLGDLRESGSLEQDADIVLFIYRDEMYNSSSDRQGIAEVIISKHRAGSTGTIDMTFMPQFTKFGDMGRS